MVQGSKTVMPSKSQTMKKRTLTPKTQFLPLFNYNTRQSISKTPRTLINEYIVQASDETPVSAGSFIDDTILYDLAPIPSKTVDIPTVSGSNTREEDGEEQLAVSVKKQRTQAQNQITVDDFVEGVRRCTQAQTESQSKHRYEETSFISKEQLLNTRWQKKRGKGVIASNEFQLHLKECLKDAETTCQFAASSDDEKEERELPGNHKKFSNKKCTHRSLPLSLKGDRASRDGKALFAKPRQVKSENLLRTRQYWHHSGFADKRAGEVLAQDIRGSSSSCSDEGGELSLAMGGRTPSRSLSDSDSSAVLPGSSRHWQQHISDEAGSKDKSQRIKLPDRSFGESDMEFSPLKKTNSNVGSPLQAGTKTNSEKLRFKWPTSETLGESSSPVSDGNEKQQQRSPAKLETVKPGLAKSPQRPADALLVESQETFEDDAGSGTSQVTVGQNKNQTMPLNYRSRLDLTKKKRKALQQRQQPDRLPKKVVQSLANHYSGLRLSPNFVSLLQDASEVFFYNLFDSLNAYANHAKRKTVNQSDIELYLKRVGSVNKNCSLYTLVRHYLPLEDQVEIIPVARAGGSIYPPK